MAFACRGKHRRGAGSSCVMCAWTWRQRSANAAPAAPEQQQRVWERNAEGRLVFGNALAIVGIFSRFDVAAVAVSAGIATQVATLRLAAGGGLPSAATGAAFLMAAGRMRPPADSAALRPSHVCRGMLISHAGAVTGDWPGRA